MNKGDADTRTPDHKARRACPLWANLERRKREQAGETLVQGGAEQGGQGTVRRAMSDKRRDTPAEEHPPHKGGTGK